jgi:PilZ domain
MSNSEKQAHAGVLTPRQCVRQKVELPFQVGGLDSLGHFFEDRIVTRDLSECGGSFVTAHSIQVGSTLKLADSTGFLSLIRIAWSRPSNDQSQGYGFAFVHPLEEQLETAV